MRTPQLLLLDQPFGALDALTRIKAQALVARLWTEHRPAVLLVTHDVEEALLLADRALVLRDGRIAEEFIVDVPLPRALDNQRLLTLRRALLTALGVNADLPTDDLESEESHDRLHRVAPSQSRRRHERRGPEGHDEGGSATTASDLKADVVVVGGGPAGTWAALTAAAIRAAIRAASGAAIGADVLLLDKGYCGTSGPTASSGTGVLYVQPAGSP